MKNRPAVTRFVKATRISSGDEGTSAFGDYPCFGGTVIKELHEYWEHLERYRAVTLQMLDMVEESDLPWRPLPAMMTLGQQFLHIAQGEDFMIHGLFHGEWDQDRARLPKQVLDIDELRARFDGIRTSTQVALNGLDVDELSGPVGQPPATRSSRLWALLEHEVHHKAQIAIYFRMMGKVPPFFAEPLEPGSRPDEVLREKLGGV